MWPQRCINPIHTLYDGDTLFALATGNCSASGNLALIGALAAEVTTRAVIGAIHHATGLLLLTDDGTLIHRLTSPKHHVHKVYEVTCKHALAADTVARLLGGVVLDDDPAPVHAVACEATGPSSLRMTLEEGRYHQVKRMLAAVANRVEALHRSAFGTWTLPADLARGAWRWVYAEAA